MHDFTIVPMQQEHLAQTESWASSQNATKTLLKQPVPSLSPTSNEYGWAAVDENQQVLAIATVKLNKEHVGYLECRVKPDERRHGIGSEIIEYVLRQPEIKDLLHLHAAVDMDNTPAQKTLDSYGFTRIGYTSGGRMEFTRHTLSK